MAHGLKPRLALLMLLLVTAGLFTMHTLGHFRAGHADPAAMEHGAGALAMDDYRSTAPNAAGPHEQPAMPMGGVVACVAILCALTVLALAGLLRSAIAGWHLGLPRMLSTIVEPARGPPKIRIGLALTELAVSRT